MAEPAEDVLQADSFQGSGDGLVKSVTGTSLARFDEDFDLRERFFDRIQVRRVGRQEEQRTTVSRKQLGNLIAFVNTVVIKDDDLTRYKGGYKHLLDIGLEGQTVHTALKRHGCLESIEGQGSDEAGVFSPILWHLAVSTFSFRGTGISRAHRQVEPTFIYENEFARVEAEHLGEPA